MNAVFFLIMYRRIYRMGCHSSSMIIDYEFSWDCLEAVVFFTDTAFPMIHFGHIGLFRI